MVWKILPSSISERFPQIADFTMIAPCIILYKNMSRRLLKTAGLLTIVFLQIFILHPSLFDSGAANSMILPFYENIWFNLIYVFQHHLSSENADVQSIPVFNNDLIGLSLHPSKHYIASSQQSKLFIQHMFFSFFHVQILPVVC
jgi:hypothetical protein